MKLTLRTMHIKEDTGETKKYHEVLSLVIKWERKKIKWSKVKDCENSQVHRKNMRRVCMRVYCECSTISALKQYDENRLPSSSKLYSFIYVYAQYFLMVIHLISNRYLQAHTHRNTHTHHPHASYYMRKGNLSFSLSFRFVFISFRALAACPNMRSRLKY